MPRAEDLQRRLERKDAREGDVDDAQGVRPLRRLLIVAHAERGDVDEDEEEDAELELAVRDHVEDEELPLWLRGKKHGGFSSDSRFLSGEIPLWQDRPNTAVAECLKH